ncbi:hypothetical protein P7K49_018391 [Saguinus oedipus]|uniref:Uncharacterized protein n=1 Tax=Saguinus oedipus TaxID=9490 RepID=A0ABQ9V678_SAGOE|nr:hypothetical protein P7K49_018391 [Saguinus oedipus]
MEKVPEEAESLEEKNMAKVHRCQLEKLKSQCDRLTEELTQNENENKNLKLKYQCLKDQLEEREFRDENQTMLNRLKQLIHKGGTCVKRAGSFISK